MIRWSCLAGVGVLSLVLATSSAAATKRSVVNAPARATPSAASTAPAATTADAIQPVAQRDLAAVLRAKPDVAAGAKSFVHCVSCHGEDGNGQSNGTVPAIAAQHFGVIAKQLVDYRHQQRWDLRMEHITRLEELKSTQDLANVAAYVSRMPRLTTAGRGTGEYLDAGERAYRTSCAGCHGPRGLGNDATQTPRLAGQHYNYLVRQIFDGIDGRRPNLPAPHVILMKQLNREQIMGIADFLARVSP